MYYSFTDNVFISNSTKNANIKSIIIQWTEIMYYPELELAKEFLLGCMKLGECLVSLYS